MPDAAAHARSRSRPTAGAHRAGTGSRPSSCPAALPARPSPAARRRRRHRPFYAFNNLATFIYWLLNWRKFNQFGHRRQAAACLLVSLLLSPPPPEPPGWHNFAGCILLHWHQAPNRPTVNRETVPYRPSVPSFLDHRTDRPSPSRPDQPIANSIQLIDFRAASQSSQTLSASCLLTSQFLTNCLAALVRLHAFS